MIDNENESNTARDRALKRTATQPPGPKSMWSENTRYAATTEDEQTCGIPKQPSLLGLVKLFRTGLQTQNGHNGRVNYTSLLGA